MELGKIGQHGGGGAIYSVFFDLLVTMTSTLKIIFERLHFLTEKTFFCLNKNEHQT